MADAGEDSSRGRRGLIDVFLFSFLVLVFLEAMPAWTTPQRVGQVIIQPLLVKSGLWQGTWQLFAPSPDKVNSFVSAEIILPDGSTHDFRQPDWSQMSVAQRWRYFRHMEYWDSIRMDDNSAAWDDLARYLARHGHPAEGVVATKVVLTRAWHEVPPPPQMTLASSTLWTTQKRSGRNSPSTPGKTSCDGS